MFNRSLSILAATPATLLALFCIGNVGTLRAAPPAPSAPAVPAPSASASASRPAETFLAVERPVGMEEIKIGICNPTSGRQGDRGKQMVRGVEALFAQVNAAGGIHGRKLRAVSYDDHYESLYTVVGTQKLINDEKVFALCSYVGTAAATVVLPMLTEANIPLVGVTSGADSLRNNSSPFLFHVRPSYAQEIDAIVNHLVKDVGLKRIAVLYQQDGFGESTLRGVERALRQHNLTLLGKAGYVRNSVDLDAAADQLVAMKPEAIILGAVFQPGAAFVRAAQARKDFKPYLCAISAISTEEFVKSAGAASEGVLVAQVFPSPNDGRNPIIAEYQTAMRALGETAFSYASLEGYLNARVLAEGLRAAGETPTARSFVTALESQQITFGEEVCAYAPGNHQGLRQVYLTKIVKSQAQPLAAPATAPAGAAGKVATK